MLGLSPLRVVATRGNGQDSGLSNHGIVFQLVISGNIATSHIAVVGIPAYSARGLVLPTPGFAKVLKVCFLGRWYLPRCFVSLATGSHNVFTVRPANFLAPDTRRICTGRVIRAVIACKVWAKLTILRSLVSRPTPWSLFN